MEEIKEVNENDADRKGSTRKAIISSRRLRD